MSEWLPPSDKTYDSFGDTVGGDSDFGGINESGGQGSGNANPDSTYPVLDEPPIIPPEPKKNYLPIIVGFIFIKYLGVI